MPLRSSIDRHRRIFPALVSSSAVRPKWYMVELLASSAMPSTTPVRGEVHVQFATLVRPPLPTPSDASTPAVIADPVAFVALGRDAFHRKISEALGSTVAPNLTARLPLKPSGWSSERRWPI